MIKRKFINGKERLLPDHGAIKIEATGLPVTACICGGNRTVVKVQGVGRLVECQSCKAQRWQLPGDIPRIDRAAS
jgi:hypothetical protein